MKRVAFAFLIASAMAAAPGFGAPVNLAPLGTASGSSEGYGTVFADGIDGNRDGEFGNGSVWHSTGHPEANPPSYFQVDLGADYYLDRVQIFPRNIAQGSIRNFRLTVFDSGNVQVFAQDFFTAAGESTNDVIWGTNALRNVVGQTVRIERLSQDPVPLSFMTLAEFEVYGQSTPIQPNLAAGSTPSANTAGGFGTALEDAIDGNIDGHYSHVDGVGSSHPIFHASTNAGNEYLQLDLGATYDLDYIHLFSRTDFAGNTSNVRFEVLAADGSTVVHTQDLQMFGVDMGAPRYNQTIDLTNVSGQFLRVSALEGGGDRFLAIAEIEAFAQPIPEPSTFALAGMALVTFAVVRRRRR